MTDRERENSTVLLQYVSSNIITASRKIVSSKNVGCAFARSLTKYPIRRSPCSVRPPSFNFSLASCALSRTTSKRVFNFIYFFFEILVFFSLKGVLLARTCYSYFVVCHSYSFRRFAFILLELGHKF